MTLQEAVDKLAAQPNIEAFLRAEGVDFNCELRGRARICPLAQWLSQQTGYRVVVGPRDCGYHEMISVKDDVDLPTNVREFLIDFDSGKFQQ